MSADIKELVARAISELNNMVVDEQTTAKNNDPGKTYFGWKKSTQNSGSVLFPKDAMWEGLHEKAKQSGSDISIKEEKLFNLVHKALVKLGPIDVGGITYKGFVAKNEKPFITRDKTNCEIIQELEDALV